MLSNWFLQSVSKLPSNKLFNIHSKYEKSFKKIQISFFMIRFKLLRIYLSFILCGLSFHWICLNFPINKFVVEKNNRGEEKEACALKKIGNTKTDVSIGESFGTCEYYRNFSQLLWKTVIHYLLVEILVMFTLTSPVKLAGRWPINFVVPIATLGSIQDLKDSLSRSTHC